MTFWFVKYLSWSGLVWPSICFYNNSDPKSSGRKVRKMLVHFIKVFLLVKRQITQFKSIHHRMHFSNFIGSKNQVPLKKRLINLIKSTQESKRHTWFWPLQFQGKKILLLSLLLNLCHKELYLFCTFAIDRETSHQWDT